MSSISESGISSYARVSDVVDACEWKWPANRLEIMVQATCSLIYPLLENDINHILGFHLIT